MSAKLYGSNLHEQVFEDDNTSEVVRRARGSCRQVGWLKYLLLLVALTSFMPTSLAIYETTETQATSERMSSQNEPETTTTSPPLILTQQFCEMSETTTTSPQIFTPLFCESSEVTEEEVQKRLWEAVERDDGPGIERAVRCGADMGMRRGDEMTPMTQAVRGGHEEAVRTLVRLGADIERTDAKLGRTPLHYAAKHGRESVVQELLAAGASAGAESGSRTTPLHLAAWEGHLDIARLLVGAGAEVNVRTIQGHTPLALAVMRGETELEAYLRSVGGQE